MGHKSSDASRPSGRPAAPDKLERLFRVLHNVRAGRTFRDAASDKYIAASIDHENGGHKPDEILNPRLPQTPERRVVEMHEIKSSLFLFADPHNLGTFNNRPLRIPEGLKAMEYLRPGAPKKKR